MKSVRGTASSANSKRFLAFLSLDLFSVGNNESLQESLGTKGGVKSSCSLKIDNYRRRIELGKVIWARPVKGNLHHTFHRHNWKLTVPL